MDKKSIFKDVVEFKQEFVEMLNDEANIPSIVLDKYQISTLLSKSKRSEVYLIIEKKTNIKRILKISNKKDNVKDSVLMELSHPAVPTFIENHTIDNKVYLIREYFEGISLEEYLEKNGVLSTKKTLKITKSVLSILKYLHNRKTPIIYRDIKAENIIIDENNDIKLIDFDISRKYDEHLNKDTVYYGTKQYSPPEQFGYSQTDERTDIYAVGILMTYLTTYSTSLENIADLDNEAFIKTIKKCTAFSPKDRYKNVLELEKALTKIQKIQKLGVKPFFSFTLIFFSLIIGICIGIALESQLYKCQAKNDK